MAKNSKLKTVVMQLDLSMNFVILKMISDISAKKTFSVQEGCRRSKVRKENVRSSSKNVQLLVEKTGQKRFERKILRLCESKGEMSYWEMWYQMTNHVLLKPDEYYNSFIGGKIHRKHVIKK